jgi:hypothetical protein
MSGGSNTMQKKRYILLSISLILAFSVGIMVFNKIDTYAVSKGTVTASNLYVRKGAGTNYSILTSSGSKVALVKNTAVTIEKKVSGWYYISAKYSGKSIKGYVSADYVKLNTADNSTSNSTTATTASTGTLNINAKVTASKLNVRKTASSSGTQLTVNKVKVSLNKNTKVTILKETMTSTGKWYYISFDISGKKYNGYVLSDYITLTLTSSVKASVNNKSSVKIRTGAGTSKSYLKDSSKKTVSLKAGSALTINKEVTVSGKKWFYVSFTYNKVKLKGYILASDTLFQTETAADDNSSGNNNDNGTSEDTNSGETNTGEDSSNNTDNTGNSNNNSNANIVIDKSITPKVGKVIGTTALNVRIGAGTSNEKLVYNNVTVTLPLGTAVNIYGEQAVSSVSWYLITFNYNGAELAGYVSGSYIQIGTETNGNGNTDSGNTNTPPDNTTPSTDGTIISDADFETNLTKEGFPESYKVLLRNLHKQYPNWQFKALNTGLDWNTVIKNESKVGLNLITNSKNIAWKSLDTGAYSWENDKFIPYDGVTWVTASKAAVEYYMDPRNFLTSTKIFQFESLSFQNEYQNQAGVERILLNTPLYNSSYTYVDDTGNNITKKYAETFINAADYSKVSPYHLATRVKQEVVSSSTSLSSSVSGTYSGYEGFYNFYNIGAYHSTVAGGAIVNALKYAKNGSTSTATNALYLIPWDNQFNAIVGGAKFIGASYIDRGQSTIYLQKFNVTSKSTYSHQYMANVEAASSESAKTYSAYSSMLELPIVFTIPIYNNMPSSVCAAPTDMKNPNNWLKSLSVQGYSLTPTFDLSKDQVYNLIVDNDITTVTVSGTAVSTKATVNGTGIKALNVGNNIITIKVTAENGNVRNYTINIVRTE